MPPSDAISLPLRIFVALTIGCAIVTAWLQPLYEMFFVGGGVFVPGRWIYLQFGSLAALLLLCFFLMRRHRALCIISWCAFCLSLVANVMPGYASDPYVTMRTQFSGVKKYDIISDYCKFECEPGVHIAVDCVSTGDKDLDEKNVRIVQGKWKTIWPGTIAFLKELRKRYNADTNFTPARMRAKLMLAETVMTADAAWEVSFTIIDDGFGEWGIAFKGSTIDPDSSQPYF